MHQPGCVVDVLLCQVVLEHVRRLDGVVVDADQNQVFFVHGISFSSNPSDALLPYSLGEPPPTAKITILKTIFSRSENQHSQVFRTDPSCSTQHRINGRITGP
jgi:hypothetical protein